MRFALLVSLALAGACRSHGLTDQYEDFKDRLCSCRDDACARDVSKELDAWSQQHHEAWATTRDEGRRVDAIEAELKACRHHFHGL